MTFVLNEPAQAYAAPILTGDAARLLNSERLLTQMALQHLDAVVATAPENVTYASGYWALSQWLRRGPQTYVLLPASDLAKSSIIASTSLLDMLADQPVWVNNVRRFGYFHVDQVIGEIAPFDQRQLDLYHLVDDGDPLASLVAAVTEAGLTRSRIGVDELGLVPGHWERLQALLPEASLVPAASLFRHTRTIKTAEEILRLRKVAHLTERSIEAALAIAEEGVTELEMASVFHQRTVAEGGLPVLGCVGFGLRSAMPNVQPSEARLKRGDVIRFDVGGRYKHYRADIARIATFGSSDQRVVDYYRALHKGTLAAIEMIRPGVKARDVFDSAVATVRAEGIPHYSRSHVGHGIGLDGYDFPDLAPSSDAVIEEGMVMCVETPYYELGWCGLQVEDMVVVRADGCENLMSTDGSLIELP